MTRKSKPPIAIYSALADTTRCRIVEILLAGPIPVHTLANAFSISRPAISRHLRVLKTAGLVAEIKKGRENLYALRPAKLGAATAWIGTIVAPGAIEETVPHGVAPLEPAKTEAPTPAVTQPEATVPSRAERAPAAAIAPQPEPAPEKTRKAVRVAPPAPSITQMGFDF